MLTRTASRTGPGTVDITFAAPAHGLAMVLAALQAERDTIGFDAIKHDQHVGKVSVVGTGVRSVPEITATFLETLTSAGIDVRQLSMSELRLSALCPAAHLDQAVRALHTAFGLDTADRVIVHAGTGR
jgi:aspartate kinase